MKKPFDLSLLLLLSTLLVACATQPEGRKPVPETPACMNYRGMMTAPMAPDAMQRLKQKCQDSMTHNKRAN